MTIRTKRLRKFRKNRKKLVFAAQIVAIWYLFILTGSYLTSDTGAYFNDVKVIKNSLHAGNWDDTDSPDNDEWDKSSLSFKGTKAWDEECKVFSTIKNSGDRANTTSTWRFYLYKVSGGEKPTSGHIATGIVPKLKSGETGQISATVKENGKYRIAFRRPLGHPGKNSPDENGYTYIWSDNGITVTKCIKAEKSDSSSLPDNEEKTEQTDSTTPKENGEMIEQPDSATPPANEEEKKQPENSKDLYPPSNEEKKDEQSEISNPTPKENNSDKSSEDNQPLSEVTKLSWNIRGKSGKVTVNWETPKDTNFSHVKVYSGKKEKLFEDNLKTTIKLENITTTPHAFTIVTVDKEGKESTGINITVSIDKVVVN